MFLGGVGGISLDPSARFEAWRPCPTLRSRWLAGMKRRDTVNGPRPARVESVEGRWRGARLHTANSAQDLVRGSEDGSAPDGGRLSVEARPAGEGRRAARHSFWSVLLVLTRAEREARVGSAAGLEELGADQLQLPQPMQGRGWHSGGCRGQANTRTECAQS